MNPNANFSSYADRLPTLLAALKACPLISRADITQHIPRHTPGIYIFYCHGQPVYVGRTRDLRRRLHEHSRPGSSHYSASFAFLRARHAAEVAGHSTSLAGFARPALATHAVFGPLFMAEKEVVAEMLIRWLQVEDAITQALLEVYAALELRTPFNSFETS